MSSSDHRKQQRRARLAAAERLRREQGGDEPKGVAKLRASLGIEETPVQARKDPAKPKVHARTAQRVEQSRAEPKESFSERAARRRAETNQPPLGLSLGAIMVMGFASMLLIQGLGGLTKAGNPVLGGLFMAFGALFLASAFFTYRRKGWAWAVCVIGTGFAAGALVAMAIFLPADLLQVSGQSIGRTSLFLWSVFFICPLLLLLLPGSRAALEWPRRDGRAESAS